MKFPCTKKGIEGVDLAVKADEGQIFMLLCQMHTEMGWFSLNKRKLIEAIQLATERRGGIVYVCKHEGQIVASLGLVFSSDWYTDDLYLHERWNYVHPDHRRGDYARRLLEAAKWTHEQFKKDGVNIPVLVGVNSNHRTHAKIRFYARHMPCIGACFAYGDFPREAVNSKLHAEREEIAKLRKATSYHKVPVEQVRPVVETIIRLTG